MLSACCSNTWLLLYAELQLPSAAVTGTVAGLVKQLQLLSAAAPAGSLHMQHSPAATVTPKAIQSKQNELESFILSLQKLLVPASARGNTVLSDDVCMAGCQRQSNTPNELKVIVCRKILTLISLSAAVLTLLLLPCCSVSQFLL